MSIYRPTGTGITTVMLGHCADAIYAWFTDNNTAIANTESLEWVKLNEFDPVTGHQISDPTNEQVIAGVWAPNDPTNPVTTAYRVSLDDGTRNRRHRGGFFPPRCALHVQANGRWAAGAIAAARSNAGILVAAVNAIDDFQVAIWSRVNGSLTPVTRLRISDVPDDISRRKNHLKEVFTSETITP